MGQLQYRREASWLRTSVRWRHNRNGGVSNHQPHHCLLNGLVRCRPKKTSKLCVTGLCAGIHRWPVNSPHKWPVTRKMFPFDDGICLGGTRIVLLPKSHNAPCSYPRVHHFVTEIWTYVHILLQNCALWDICQMGSGIFLWIYWMTVIFHFEVNLIYLYGDTGVHFSCETDMTFLWNTWCDIFCDTDATCLLIQGVFSLSGIDFLPPNLVKSRSREIAC